MAAVACPLGNDGNTALTASMKAGRSRPIRSLPAQVVTCAPRNVTHSGATKNALRWAHRNPPYCPNAGTFLFWDGAHPTAAGHRIVAQHAAAAMGLAWPH